MLLVHRSLVCSYNGILILSSQKISNCPNCFYLLLFLKYEVIKCCNGRVINCWLQPYVFVISLLWEDNYRSLCITLVHGQCNQSEDKCICIYVTGMVDLLNIVQASYQLFIMNGHNYHRFKFCDYKFNPQRSLLIVSTTEFESLCLCLTC
jgi:hypothetical protein